MIRALLTSIGCLVLAGCGGGEGRANTPTGASASCDLAVAGPLVGITYQPKPEPPITGGVLADGIYDLVGLVDYHGLNKPPDPPIIRLSYRFTTQERSSNHAEGRLDIAGGPPPGHACLQARFAIMGSVLRQTSERTVEERSFSVTQDGFWMVDARERNLDRVSYVFRRRQ
jgi:hypothetical protein